MIHPNLIPGKSKDALSMSMYQAEPKSRKTFISHILASRTAYQIRDGEKVAFSLSTVGERRAPANQAQHEEDRQKVQRLARALQQQLKPQKSGCCEYSSQ
jgi:hypothetical protein